jgi:hypothetical protein
MSKQSELEHILKLYESILTNSHLDEASSSSSDLFDGKSVKIPADGAHGGQSGWQSSNAWDIMAPVGTPVYALADGVAQTFSDYGRNVVKTQGKKLYGQSFTVKSDDGLPDIYYTHLERSPVTKGSKIQCGQLIGYIMDFPNSSADHVHIGVERGNIRQFLNDDGSIKCAKGQKLSGYEIDSPSSSEETSSGKQEKTSKTKKSNLDIDMGKYGNTIPDFATKALGQLKTDLGLKEQSSKGKEKFFLQFCNVTQKQVKNGQQVSSGTLLGKTDEDVQVTKMDSLGNRVKLKKGDLNLGKDLKEYLGVITIPKDSNSKIKSPVSGTVIEKYSSSCKNQIILEYFVGQDIVKTERGKQKDPAFTDPLLGAILTAPLAAFKDQYDDSGQLKQKRFGYAGERVDPWVKDLIVKPFKSIGNLYRKENTEEEERKKKKVNENIEKIKKLMK